MAFTKAQLFENVVMKLSVLRYVVRSLSGRGLTDVNRRCESFFCGVLNRVYGYSLVDLNAENLNAAAIDLGDPTAKVCFQVTSTSASPKIHDTIRKFLKHNRDKDYNHLRFLMLVEKKAYTTTFDTAGRFAFDKKTDILDIDDLLDAVEKLPLERLRELSQFVDDHLHPLTRSLAPTSLLAQAEVNEPRRPADAKGFLDDCGIEGDRSRSMAIATLGQLLEVLGGLSRSQRELIAYIMTHGKRSQFGDRVAMAIQTLQQRMNLDAAEMRSYYDSLSRAGLMDLDSEERVSEFELTHSLDPHADTFWCLREYLKTEPRIRQTIVDLDFRVLD
jgi:predicted transcriptional regulator